MISHLIKVYHGYTAGKKKIASFITDINEILDYQKIILGLNYHKGEFFYSLNCSETTYPTLESQFYTTFDNFQITSDSKGLWNYDPSKTVIATLELSHGGYFPFLFNPNDDTGLMFNMLRSFENLDIVQDKFGYFVSIQPVNTNGLGFYMSSWWDTFKFKTKLRFQSYKHLFSIKTQKNRKEQGFAYHQEKLQKKLSKVTLYMVCQSENKTQARAKIKSIANNFEVFKNYPLNEFQVKKWNGATGTGGGFVSRVQSLADSVAGASQPTPLTSEQISADLLSSDTAGHLFTPDEIAQIFQFPQNPKNETSLFKVTSKKLSLPIGIPTLPFTRFPNGEIKSESTDHSLNVIGISDFRSIAVPIGFYDEDRLKHTYIIGKT
jgi:hypothetical protein